MNILLIGSGGREAAIAFALKQSEHIGALYVSPGSDGLAEIASIEPKMDMKKVVEFAIEHQIDLVIFGGEAELVEGQADALRANGVKVLGSSKAASTLEGSKDFLKDVLFSANVPCANSRSFTDLEPALDYLEASNYPIVLKTDGLAGGKGVVICETKHDAKDWVEKYLSGEAFGAAGTCVIIEDYIEGPEISFFVLVDATGNAHPLAAARDHKRIFDDDKGANTGGMGAFTPVLQWNENLQKQIMNDIISPSLKEMEKRGIPYSGFLFAGLMLTTEGPKLLEYNVRLGDPETQVILQDLPVDFLILCHEAASGAVSEIHADQLAKFKSQRTIINVVLAAEGYPENPKKGAKVDGLDGLKSGIDYFHSGTRLDDGWKVHGGRVLNILGYGQNIDEAREDVYAKVKKVKFSGMQFRKDIGKT